MSFYLSCNSLSTPPAALAAPSNQLHANKNPGEDEAVTASAMLIWRTHPGSAAPLIAIDYAQSFELEQAVKTLLAKAFFTAVQS